jgi:hypothetical protein
MENPCLLIWNGLSCWLNWQLAAGSGTKVVVDDRKS